MQNEGAAVTTEAAHDLSGVAAIREMAASDSRFQSAVATLRANRAEPKKRALAAAIRDPRPQCAVGQRAKRKLCCGVQICARNERTRSRS